VKVIHRVFIVALAFIFLMGSVHASAQQTNPNLRGPAERNARTRLALIEEVRHQLLTLPYYGIFDWLEAGVERDGSVILRGQVVRPSTKDDAEERVKKLEGVKGVVNQIEVLPLSTFDDETRIATYRRLAAESSLTKYFTQAVPPIHIIVKNGRLTLKGIVASAMDAQVAYTAASSVPNVFEVKNELRVEGAQKTT
jgi:hyperosmotically inducible protein